MKINLSKIKVGRIYNFSIYYDSGAGSGSQGWYDILGKVKEINPEFIRVIPAENLLAANRRSIKIYNNSITKINKSYDVQN